MEQGVDGGGTQNRYLSWFSNLVPVTSTSWILAISVFLLSSWFPALAWLPSLLIFAYLESGGRMRESRREEEFRVGVEEEGRRKLREELVRLAVEQEELKIRFEEEFANAHNQLMNEAARKEASLAEDFEQSGEGGDSDEGSLEESNLGVSDANMEERVGSIASKLEKSKNRSDANLEERMDSFASKLEESVLLQVEAKLEQIVEAAVMLRISGAEDEQFEKSSKLEEIVEKAVRLRLAAEQKQLDNSSTNRSGEVFY